VLTLVRKTKMKCTQGKPEMSTMDNLAVDVRQLQNELRGLRLDVKSVLSEPAEVNTTIRSHDKDSTEELIKVLLV